MNATFDIANKPVGGDAPCFVIAEAGVNHNGDLNLAKELVRFAARAGADAVKFQTFSADKLVSPNAPRAEYQIAHTGTTETQHEMLRRLELTPAMHRVLADLCASLGILFLSTPFDADSADLLESLGVSAFKVPSGEITNLPFLEHIARKRKPMIVSTGMAWLGEVEQAVRTISACGNDRVALLHCVSRYPADPGSVNLRSMETMRQAFHVPVGYSDHTAGIDIAIGAAALGAAVIEKHFTLDRTLPGPDHVASVEPAELTAMIRGIRNVQAALGDGKKQPVAGESETAQVARRSLVAARNIDAGETLDLTMVALKRPGTGLPPAMREHVIGRVARVAVKEGELLRLDMLQ